MGATRFNTAVCDAPLTRQVIEKKIPAILFSYGQTKTGNAKICAIFIETYFFFSSSTKQGATNAFDKRA